MTSDGLAHQASAEGDGLRAKLREAEARLEGARKRHAEEVAGLEATATHELTLEKQAANRTVTQLQTQLSQMTARAERAEAQLSSSERQLADAAAEATRQRMAAHEANVRAQQVERAASGMQQAAESAMKRADACEAEAREIASRRISWKDERAALTTELHAERAILDKERLHLRSLEASLAHERQVRRSMETLLETRLGELSSETQPEDLAKGAEALQLLLGTAAIAQAALEQREALLADIFMLFDTRHADRIVALEGTATHRHRCDAAHAKLDSTLARLDALETARLDALETAPPTAAALGPPPTAASSGASSRPGTAAAAAEHASAAGSSPDTGLHRGSSGPLVLRQELREVAGLLLAASKAGSAASDVVAAQEAAVQAAIHKFAARFDQYQSELKHSKERIAELERALAKAGAKAPPAPVHRPPPTGSSAAPKSRQQPIAGGGRSPRGPPSPDWLPKNR